MLVSARKFFDLPILDLRQPLYLILAKVPLMIHGRLSGNQYRICPCSIKECGFDTDRRFKSGFYRLVKFDRGRKPSGWKGHIWFGDKPYRV